MVIQRKKSDGISKNECNMAVKDRNMQKKKGGAICGGGPIPFTTFWEKPELYMMSIVLPDDKYEEYLKMIERKEPQSKIKKFICENQWN